MVAEANSLGIDEANKIAEENIALAVFFASRFRWALNVLHMDFDDLLGEFKIELIRASRVYDPSRGKFTTVAGRYIARRFDRLWRDANVQKRQGSWRCKSIFLNDCRLYSKSEQPYEGMMSSDDKSLLAKALGRMSDRQRYVLNARVIDERKLIDVGRELGISSERVRKIQSEAIAKARECCGH